MSLYNPGNAVVVNLLMRWPILTPVVAAIAIVAPVIFHESPPPPLPLPAEVAADTTRNPIPPVVKELPPKRKIGG